MQQFIVNQNLLLMKKLFGMLFCTIMLIAYANAQQVDSSDNYYFVKEKLENYYDDLIQRYGEDSLEGKDYKRFLRWKWFMEKRHGTGGSLSSYSKAINTNLRSGDSSINSVPWELIGPVGVPADYDGELESSRGKGMIISIHVNPNNMSEIYAGGHHGGLFYTDDGGYTWQHLTKDYPEIKGVQSIVVHPDSDSTIFIVTHNWMSNHSRGMYKSTDKGNTWEEVAIIIGGDNFYPSNYKEREPKKLIMHPDSSNIMYLLTICHILKTDDGGLSWEEVFHESYAWWGMKDSVVNDSCNDDYDCVMGLRQLEGLKDIAFDTYDPSTIYAVGHVILRSQQYGEAGTWDSITEQITGRIREYTLRMDTDPAHPGYVWIYGDSLNMDGFASGHSALYKHYSLTGSTEILLNVNSPDVWDIKVSPTNDTLVYFRKIGLYAYDPRYWGDELKSIANRDKDPPKYIHADKRDFNIYSHNGKDTIFVANDGGVCCGGDDRSPMAGKPDFKWKDISALNPDFKKHLNVTEFYAMDALQGNSDYVIGNCQDLSGFFRQDSKWYHTAGGDGGGIVIDKDDPRYIYYQDLQGGLRRSSDRGKTFNGMIYVKGNRLTVPMALDPDNPQNLYVGRKDLYLFQNARTNSGVADTIRWTGHEGGDEEDPKDITAIKFASDDRMYVGTDKQYKKDTVFTDVLWRSDNNGQTWTDISDSLAGVVFGYVNCIETHPSDDDKFWVGFTNVNAVCKLWYSGNAGQNYQEFDQGLPDSIPVWKIKFDKFANDLYIATDLGVFHRDLDNPAGEWQPYNYGSVNKVVTDIFIHEQGRIIAATYGNSMWETSTVCEEYSDTPIEITGYSIWQSPTRINQSIIIEDGGLLKVTDDVYLSELSRIIVKRGGKLVVDGGRLSSSCKNGQWRGIELHGNSYQPQNDSFQGTVKVIDGGIIENALCGIRVYRITPPPNPEGNWEQDYNGGIVQCDSAFFINNEVAVEFKTYPTESDSYFHRTNFITDDRAYDGFEPESFVGMLGMRGVDFKGCIFENKMTKPGLTYAEKGYGIYSVASRYTVDDYCLMDVLDCEEPIITEFRNLNYGIHATDYRYIMAPTIRNSEFKYNKTGVYLGGINGAVVERNTFNTEPISGSPGEDIMGGLYLDHSTAYSVQENEFTTYDSSGFIQNTVGLVVNEGGEQNNQIYNNYFERQEWALMAQGRNRNDGGSQGLRIKCNEFYLCERDIAITDSLVPGIARMQGDSLPIATAMAGNLFHIEEGAVNWNHDDILNGGELIYYFYPEPAIGKAENRVKPRDYDTVTVKARVVAFDPAWTYEEGCPSQLDQVHDVEELRAEMDLSNQQIDSTENILSVLIDGGDTEELQSDVAYSIPSESAQLYSELMAESPYLSDTVISTAIEKEDVLPNVMIRDVMSANPNTAKSEKLMNKLDTRLDPLPDYMKQQILQGKDIFSIREETENALASYKSRKAKIFNELIRHYRHGTLNPAASADSIISMYRNENELWAKYALAFEYLDRDDSLNTFSTLDEIPVHFNLSAKQVAEHQNYTDLIALLYELEASGRTVFQVDSAEVAELYLLYENSQGGLKAGIRNVLQSIDTLSYNEPYLFPDQFKSSGVYHEDNDQKNSVKEVLLTVHPNPARDYIIIKCILPFEQKATIEIHDISGKPVTVLDVFNKTDQKIINTHNWNSGVYIARLKTNRQVVESVKFLVVK